MVRPRKTTLIVGAALGLAAAGGVALASDSAPLGSSDLESPGSVRIDEATLPDDDAAEQAALDELATVDRAGAEAAALEAAGGGTVVASELEEEDGSVIWEVEVRLDDGSTHEVSIDAGNRTVLGTEPEEPDDDGDDAAEQAALDELATVDRAGAEAAALEAAGGGTVVASELEEEDGSVIWEVDVRLDDGSTHEVSIDARDATVLGTEPED